MTPPLRSDFPRLLLEHAQAQLAARVAEHCDAARLAWTPEPAAVADADGWVDPTRRYAALRDERLRAARKGQR